jgi:radical SAM enzyme (TIGR01210 family)
VGNLPAQIRAALTIPDDNVTMSASRWIKLYNASNFFAPYNVPTQDLPAIAELVRGFDRIIVENHPLLTSPKIADFAKLLNGQLEVAMGLETVDVNSLRKLNKQVTVDEVRRATEQLTGSGLDVRLFVLLRPPGLSEAAGIECCLESIEAAREWGARHVSVIPVRAGNGAMEQLQARGLFEPPLASSLETVLCQSVSKSPMVITADLWDWGQLRGLCSRCNQPRMSRMQNVNLTQRADDAIACDC